MNSKRTAALVFAVLLTITMVLSLTACNNSNPTSTATTILRVGVDDSYPPMEYKDTDGKTIIGFDIDVAMELGKRMGRPDVQFISNDWTGIFAALETGKFDVIISSVSINDDRLAAHSLTDAYIANKLVMVTAKSITNITSPDGLLGKKVGVQAGTTSEDFCKDLIGSGKLKEADLQTYPLVTQPFLDLDAGRIDAIIVDIVVAKYYISHNSDKYRLAWESPTAEPMALCFAKKDGALRDQANLILKAMRDDGTMKTISVKWFGEDVTSNLQ